MTDLVLAMMAGLLGASTLAIVLLYRGWKSNRKLITDLKAQVAVQQIAVLTGGVPVSAVQPQQADDQEQEPARRKGHLALYIGGGVVAAFWAIGDRIRSAWRGHKVLTVTTVATVATVSTAAALYLAPAGDSTNSADDALGIARVPDYSPGRAGTPDDDTEGLATEDVGAVTPYVADSAGARLAGGRGDDAGSPDPRVQDEPAVQPGPVPGQTAQAPPNETETPPNSPGGQVPEHQPGQGEDPVPTPTPDPDPTPTPGPTPDPGSGPDPDPGGKPPEEDDGLLCVKLPPLLDLCVL